jgi:serine phosphatase RsbU (regulator of sigma subunit)
MSSDAQATGRTTIFQRIFDGVDEEALQLLRAVAEKRTYPPGTVLCNQGAIEHVFYVVEDGRVAITQQLEDGQERLLSVRGPGEFFGELGLLDAAARMANCTTLTETTVLELTEELFDRLLATSPVIAYALIHRVLSLLRETDRRSIDELVQKNRELHEAFEGLKAAQSELVEKGRLDHELEIAANVQRTLLPASLPCIPHYELAAYLRPARQVGGDFYDAVLLEDDHLGLLLADVADKSVQAALIMAVARTLFKVEAHRSLRPADVALAVHRGMLAVAPAADMFVTAFYGVLHGPTGRLDYVIAGHERPLLVRPGTGVHTLPGRGRFLGMLEGLALDQNAIDLLPGDKLVIFSDGVPDMVDPEGQHFGAERLQAFLERHGHLEIEKLVLRLTKELAIWCGEMAPFDDVTILALEALKS